MSDSTSRTALPLRIAGVDADPVTRELLALYLEPLGVTLCLESSVRAVLRTLEQLVPHAFFLAEAALAEADEDDRRALRQRLAALPVVVLQEPGQGPDWSRDWPMVQARLSKPVPLDAVLTLCRQWGAQVEGATVEGAPGSGVHPLAGLEALIGETGMDNGLVGELLDSFLERMPVYLGELRGALDADDREGLRRTLHSLKGMCANLRFGGLVSLSEAVRGAALAGDHCAATTASDRLRAEFNRIAAAVTARRVQAG